MSKLITDETSIPAGSLARVIRNTHLGEYSLREGAQVEIEDFVGADEAEDGIPFYWALRNDSNVTVRAEDLEIVKTTKEMQSRRIPTRDTLLDYISSELLGNDGIVDIHSTDRDATDIEVYGRTHDGLNFGFVLSISDIHQTDF